MKILTVPCLPSPEFLQSTLELLVRVEVAVLSEMLAQSFVELRAVHEGLQDSEAGDALKMEKVHLIPTLQTSDEPDGETPQVLADLVEGAEAQVLLAHGTDRVGAFDRIADLRVHQVVRQIPRALINDRLFRGRPAAATTTRPPRARLPRGRRTTRSLDSSGSRSVVHGRS